MSVGFENSALKMSFSLSSLPPSSGTLENTEHVRLRAERPYHSLTKKPRRDPKKDSWRHSWGSREENKDEFWAALQPNYNYIMDNKLIDSCKEANGELSWDDEDMAENYTWTLSELMDQFSELYSWLNSIQEAVYGKGGSVVDKNFKTSYIEDVQRKNYRRKLFNEQAGKLLSKYPDSRDDISRHVSHLNAKWELVEELLSSGKDSLDKNIPYIDVQHEISCLRKWIKHMESTLQPLDFRTGQTWSLQEIEEKAKEHMALQRDISAQGRVVSLVVRLAPAAKVARHLERRWHHLYLRALEWQCHVEALAARVRSPGPTGSYSESDEEPAPKQRRLTDSGDVTDEGSYFEDDLDYLCVMEGPPQKNGDGETDAAPGNPGDAVDCSSFNKSDWTANNYGTFYFKHTDTDSDHGRTRNSIRKESAGSLEEPKSVDDSSEDDGWTYTAGSPTSKQNRRSDSSTCDSVVAKNNCSVPRLELGSSGSEAGKTNFPEKEEAKQIKYSPMRRSSKDLPRQRGNAARVFEPLVFDTIGPQTKCARTKEWLQKHLSGGKLQPMDSCDASGEYTTGDSDDEKHSESSEDLNGSVATFRQVDITPGEGSRSASVECFPDNEVTPTAEKLRPSGPLSPEQGNIKVVMRNKHRQMSAERPWSVSGISQICRQTVLVDRDPLAQLSFSESAINEIVTSPPRNKTKSFIGFSGSVDRNVSSSTIEETTMHLAEGSGSRNGSLRRRRFKLRKRGVVRKSECGSDGHKSVMVKSGSFSGTSAAPTKLHERSSFSESAVVRQSSAEEESLQLPVFQLGPIDHVDSDVDKASTQGTEEQLSSFSEQAWDNYQEKYMSEPYSEELADMETARRLLEFGDDYRNYLDSQSDCSWGVSGNDSTSSLRRRKPPVPTEESSLFDSDSDMEDIQHAICLSQAQLEYTEKVIHDQIHKVSPELVLATDYAEIAATCSENIRCLNVISEKGELLPPKKMMEMKGWLERWEALHSTAEELQRVRSLQREMTALREEMTLLAARVCTVSGDLTDREQLEKIIQQVKAELSGLRERKAALLKVNVAVHRYHPARLLKEDVSELYRVWDEAVQRTSQQLHALQRAAQAWQQFDASLEELQGLLRGDGGALRMLDAALRGGALRPDVARVLSEKQEALCRRSPQLSEHGSLSDSGISDSGSERELSERERRLAALRGLARHLAASLPAGSAALAGVARQMELAEATLRTLQKSCRDLLLHAAHPQPHPQPQSQPRPRRRRPVSRESRPWMWRVVRAALPIQVALMLLLCVACLNKTHCCDAINNLEQSLTLQLLYTNGPPPT